MEGAWLAWVSVASCKIHSNRQFKLAAARKIIDKAWSRGGRGWGCRSGQAWPICRRGYRRRQGFGKGRRGGHWRNVWCIGCRSSGIHSWSCSSCRRSSGRWSSCHRGSTKRRSSTSSALHLGSGHNNLPLYFSFILHRKGFRSVDRYSRPPVSLRRY
jgi:hypothetical protein